MAEKKHKISKKLEIFLNEHSELNDSFLNLRDAPTSRQVFYALYLGINLNGQTFKTISKFIEYAQQQSNIVNSINVPFDLRDEAYKLLLENSKDKLINDEDRQICLKENYLLFPPNTTYSQLEKAINKFYDGNWSVKCPYCNELLCDVDFKSDNENRCFCCQQPLLGFAIKVKFTEKGRPVFEKKLISVFSHPPKMLKKDKLQQNIPKEENPESCLIYILIIIFVYCMWRFVTRFIIM